MKRKFVSILLAALMLLSVLPFGASAAQVSDFSDVKNGAWYYDAVEYATGNGLFSGTSTTTFEPGVTMDRGMFVTVTGRLAEVPDTYGRNQSSPFTDLTQADYFYPFTVWANDNNIVNGTGGGKFSPKSAVTREQMATILFKYARFAGYDLAFSDSKYVAFADNSKVSAYAVDAMKWATYNGIINGISGKLEPQEKSTRAQVAQVLYNFSKINAEEPEKPEPENPGENGNWWENYDPGYVRKTGQSAPDMNGGYYDYDMANDIMDAINDLRRQAGLTELIYQPLIQEWASIRAEEASKYFSHTRPDGTSCTTVGHSLSTENLAWITTRQNNADTIVNGWYDSQGHRQNMLSKSASLGAISCYVIDGKIYAAHLFSTKPLYIFDMD